MTFGGTAAASGRGWPDQLGLAILASTWGWGLLLPRTPRGVATALPPGPTSQGIFGSLVANRTTASVISNSMTYGSSSPEAQETFCHKTVLVAVPFFCIGSGAVRTSATTPRTMGLFFRIFRSHATR